ncbi:MAG: pseudouridine synthase [Planctomycetota bacterium]
MRMRLHKFLGRCGVASRRKAEALMRAGLVAVNGRPALEPGLQIDPDEDRVTVDGKAVRAERKVYVVLHKPRGYVTTAADERGRKTALDLVEGVQERLYPVGRLDRESEGLLVLTNDGDLALYLTHPRSRVTKTYRVTVEGFVSDETLAALRAGVRVGGRKVVPRRLALLHRGQSRSTLEIEIGEGLNREVRRLFAAAGHEARKLVRTRVGPLSLEGLPRGRARFLTPQELAALRAGMGEHDASRGKDLPPAKADRPRPLAKAGKGKGPRASSRARPPTSPRPGGEPFRGRRRPRPLRPGGGKPQARRPRSFGKKG